MLRRRGLAASAWTRRSQHLSTYASARELRSSFLNYFAQREHEVVPSASLIPPAGDSSLLFTNAGMVPFKQVFQGAESRPYNRATSAQRCVRAGGKHNDLEQVGITRRHHTLFEMLGSFSFGDYFKEQAIQYSWTFLTQELGLPADRMLVTVLESDKEARDLWKKIANLPDDRIRMLDEGENFWAMGDTGPCGPCSEIFWDLGDHIQDPEERYLELWNLVFMQFNRSAKDADLTNLPRKSVDTGMGLERVASVLQNVPSNYHTDAFVPLMEQVAATLDVHSSSSMFSDALSREVNPQNPEFGDSNEIRALRLTADHLRTSYAMLHDGIFPSNVGRGYVLRRILRRVIRHAQRAGVTGHDFLSSIELPEWREQYQGLSQMQNIVRNEERAFHEMLANGQKAIDRAFTTTVGNVLSGREAFKLYDTYGIPLDLTHQLAEEKGVQVDVEGFEKCLEEHKKLATERSVFSSATADSSHGMEVGVGEFIGYESLTVNDATILGSWKDKKEGIWVVLDRCPFYPEGGGQVGDRGSLVVKGSEDIVKVVDAQKQSNGAIAIRCVGAVDSMLTEGAQVDAKVDQTFRDGCARHHSATHLLQAALKKVLGDHVTQSGSMVSNDRLRFDFAHFGALTTEELALVQDTVNDLAMASIPCKTEEMAKDQAEQSGAICNFGDKYGDVVRVVSFEGSEDLSSKEFCGGTHVDNTSSVFPFVILSEGSVAAGMRRTEAVAGIDGARYLQKQEKVLEEVAGQLETTVAKVPERLSKLQKQIKTQEKQSQSLRDTLARLPNDPTKTGTLQLKDKGVQVQLHVMAFGGEEGVFSQVARQRAEWLAIQEPFHTHVVMIGKFVACAAGEECSGGHAGQVLKAVVQNVGGRGGGNANSAQGSLPKSISDVDQDKVKSVLA